MGDQYLLPHVEDAGVVADERLLGWGDTARLCNDLVAHRH